MKLKLTRVTILIFLFTVFAFASSESIEFKINSDTKIILNDSSTSVEKTAASELSSYLSEMLGSDIKISTCNGIGIDNAIILGTPSSSEFIKNIQDDIELSNIKDDGFIVVPVKKNQKEVLVIASNQNRGVLYGVYALLEKLGVKLRLDNDLIPQADSFIFQGTLKDQPFFKHRSGGSIDAILRWWEPIPYEGIEKMWKWHAQNRLNMFGYHSMAGNYPDNPELHAFLGTCLGSYLYFEDYPNLQWKQRHGPTIEKARKFLTHLIESGQRWGIDIVLSLYEPGYPEGLLEAYPEIKGPSHYPCPANEKFWEYIESEYRELFRTFPGLKGVMFATGENKRGNLLRSICDKCCGVERQDKENWKIKQWERPGLISKRINNAVRSVAPDAMVIFRPHLLDMTLGKTAQIAAKWDPYIYNPLMHKTLPKDIVVIRRPHDHDYISNAGHNLFLGAKLSPNPEGILLSGGGEYRGKLSIPCAEVEEFSAGKARIPHFAKKGVNELIVAKSFYLPGMTGPTGSMGVDFMNQDHFAQLAWNPLKPADEIWRKWADRYFPDASKGMIEVFKPTYQMMYHLGYETEFDVRGKRFSFPYTLETPKKIQYRSVEVADKSYKIAADIYSKFTSLENRIPKDDFDKTKKYLLENKKVMLFWLNFIKANYYCFDKNEDQLQQSISTLSKITPTLDFPICPWIDVHRHCVTAPISYQENGTKFIANASKYLNDPKDYSYPIIDLYKYDDHTLDEGLLCKPPYITFLIHDIGSGVDYRSLSVAIDGKAIDISKLEIIKNCLLNNPSFERGLHEYSDEWIPGNKNSTTKFESIRRGDGTEHSGTDCIKITAKQGLNLWITDKPIKVSKEGGYKMSCWIKTEDLKGKAYIGVREIAKDGTILADNKSENFVSGDSDWKKIEFSLKTNAQTDRVKLLLMTEGVGQVWFDDVCFYDLEDTNLGKNSLVIYTPAVDSPGKHSVTINVRDNAGNSAPEATILYQIKE